MTPEAFAEAERAARRIEDAMAVRAPVPSVDDMRDVLVFYPVLVREVRRLRDVEDERTKLAIKCRMADESLCALAAVLKPEGDQTLHEAATWWVQQADEDEVRRAAEESREHASDMEGVAATALLRETQLEAEVARLRSQISACRGAKRRLDDALRSVQAALGDRLLAKGPLAESYAHAVMREITEALEVSP